MYVCITSTRHEQLAHYTYKYIDLTGIDNLKDKRYLTFTMRSRASAFTDTVLDFARMYMKTVATP